MFRSRLILAILGIILYLAGVIARYQYGISVVVRNHSRETLRDVAVKVDARGSRYPLPDLPPGHGARVFVDPVTESAINLEYIDSRNVHCHEMLAGYVEAGYTGSARATVKLDGTVDTQDDTFRIAYWRSWAEFLW